jgi:hypothetical protein
MFDCGEINHRISILRNELNLVLPSILSNSNESFQEFLIEKGIGTNLEKITLIINKVEQTFLYMYSTNIFFFDTNNADVRIYYSSYSMNRLSNSESTNSLAKTFRTNFLQFFRK